MYSVCPCENIAKMFGHAIIWRWISPKIAKDTAIVGTECETLDEAKPSFQMVPFSMTLSDL